MAEKLRGTKRASFRFYAELNDFLPPSSRFRAVDRAFHVGSTVKDMIESLGVPHTEVDLVVVAGDSVDFDYVVQDGDAVNVYPMFESIDVAPVLKVRPEPLRHPRFVADVNLGQLARHLRLLGFDVVYDNAIRDAELAGISARDRRVLLTRDVDLLKRSAVTHGYWVRANEPRAQVIEVIDRFDLWATADPFSRCMECNGQIVDVSKKEIIDVIEPRTRNDFEDFRMCVSCKRVYWSGSHRERLVEFIEHVRAHTQRRSDLDSRWDNR